MSLIAVDRAYSKYFIFLIKDQFLRNVKQRPNLGKLCVLRDTQIIFRIFSEMYSCLHIRIHKQSPDRCVGVDLPHFVFLGRQSFCRKYLKTFSTCSTLPGSIAKL